MLHEWLKSAPRPTFACAIVSLPALALSFFGGAEQMLGFDPAWAAIILCGVPILHVAGRGILNGFDIRAGVLVSIALIAAVVTEEYFAAGEVALIMQLGTLLEDWTVDRARQGIESLLQYVPQTAHVLRDGKESLLPVDEIRRGDLLRIHAGEAIPVDGILTEGESAVDASMMTGESLPVDKHPGDALMSGTINTYGIFTMRAERTGADSSLQRMIALARDVDAKKAPIVRLADRWASRLVLAALVCAGAIWWGTGEFIRAVTALVVFCPCALVLATPTAVAAAIANLTQRGILIRRADALERLAKVDTIAFDKTGTLTSGTPSVIAVQSLSDAYAERDILRLAAAAEQHSEHPLGRAVTAAWRNTGEPLPAVSGVQVLAGKGISAKVGGKGITVGKPTLFSLPESALDFTMRYTQDGASVSAVAADGKIVGMIALADCIRSDTPKAITSLRHLGLTPLLLTGDNARVAEHIGTQAGITEIQSDLLPDEKMKHIERRGPFIAMVGDGVNDALALRSAYAGIAMGGIGSDIAVASADAVLVSDDIRRLPALIRMAHRTMKKIQQNIIFGLAINFIALGLSAAGILTPATGALWHNAGSLFVVVNAALLLTVAKKEKNIAFSAPV